MFLACMQIIYLFVCTAHNTCNIQPVNAGINFIDRHSDYRWPGLAMEAIFWHWHWFTVASSLQLGRTANSIDGGRKRRVPRIR